MISCNECQKKIASVFDNEASEGNESLISDHIQHCPNCQAFRGHMIKMRQALVSDPVPFVSLKFPQECMQGIVANGNKSKEPNSKEKASINHASDKFRSLVFVSGLAAAFLIITSLLACLLMVRKVVALNHELQVSQQNLSIAYAERQTEDEREKQEKVYMALFLRMAELEDRFENSSQPRATFLTPGQHDFFYKQGDL